MYYESLQVWKKEILYSEKRQVGHVIGAHGVNVKRWLADYGCSTFIDNYRKRIVITGINVTAVLKTTCEVQEKLILYWQFNDRARNERCQYLNTIIEEKNFKLENIKREIEETQSNDLRVPQGWPKNEPCWI